MLTERDIRNLLGLKDPIAHALEVFIGKLRAGIPLSQEEMIRGTGRTTVMLVEAAHNRVYGDDVVILATPAALPFVKLMVSKMQNSCGLFTVGSGSLAVSSNPEEMKMRGGWFYLDHSLLEKLSSTDIRILYDHDLDGTRHYVPSIHEVEPYLHRKAAVERLKEGGKR